MPWLLLSPGHQQPWYWLHWINRSLSFTNKDCNYMHHLSVEKWQKIQILYFLKITSAWHGFNYFVPIVCLTFHVSLQPLQSSSSYTLPEIPSSFHQIKDLRWAVCHLKALNFIDAGFCAQNISCKLVNTHYHACWCPVSWHQQGICNDLNFLKWRCSCFLCDWISTNRDIAVWRNYNKCINIFVLQEKR